MRLGRPRLRCLLVPDLRPGQGGAALAMHLEREVWINSAISLGRCANNMLRQNL